jgi:hypothetical protein
MNSTRKLSLKRERLTELSNDQLDGLAGGLSSNIAYQLQLTIVVEPTIPVTACACATDSDCVSLDRQCIDTYRNVCGGIVVRA